LRCLHPLLSRLQVVCGHTYSLGICHCLPIQCRKKEGASLSEWTKTLLPYPLPPILRWSPSVRLLRSCDHCDGSDSSTHEFCSVLLLAAISIQRANIWESWADFSHLKTALWDTAL
jgi:hypothetical protein